MSRNRGSSQHSNVSTDDYGSSDSSDDLDEIQNIPEYSGVDIDSLNPYERRKHHNALERRRRELMKEAHEQLMEAIPSVRGGKASREVVLRHCYRYIEFNKGKAKEIEKKTNEMKKKTAKLKEYTMRFSTLVKLDLPKKLMQIEVSKLDHEFGVHNSTALEMFSRKPDLVARTHEEREEEFVRSETQTHGRPSQNE